MDIVMLVSFLFFTSLVGALTWWITRKDDHATTGGYFLAGRSLTFPLIAGSLLLTNLSTEQMVGLNGTAFKDGFCVMVWEVVAVVALVFMAWFFLPRFLKSGVATVPEYLEIRFDHGTQVITNIIFLVAYVGRGEVQLADTVADLADTCVAGDVERHVRRLAKIEHPVHRPAAGRLPDNEFREIGVEGGNAG